MAEIGTFFEIQIHKHAGCYVEGGDWLRNRFPWATNLGPNENRTGHLNDVWGYWSTDGEMLGSLCHIPTFSTTSGSMYMIHCRQACKRPPRSGFGGEGSNPDPVASV